MMWAVQLGGNLDFLEKLSMNLQAEVLKCFSHGSRYYLIAERFQHLNIDEVHDEATKITRMIAGIASINLNLWPPEEIQILSVAEIDENMCIVKHHAFSDLNQVSHVRANLNSEQNSLNEVNKWVELAFSSENVAKVFRLLRSGIDDYVNSYRIYEIIKHDMTRNEKKSLGFLGVEDSKLERFKITANRPDLSGDRSRHGITTGAASKRKVMTTNEVESFIYEMVYKWLHYKLKNLCEKKPVSYPND